MYTVIDADGNQSSTGHQTQREALRVAARIANDCNQVRYVVKVGDVGSVWDADDSLVVYPA